MKDAKKFVYFLTIEFLRRHVLTILSVFRKNINIQLNLGDKRQHREIFIGTQKKILVW